MSDQVMDEHFRLEAEMVSELHNMSGEDLQSFTELHEDPTSNDQIELYIYTSFLNFQRALLEEYLEQAIHQAQGWIAVTPADSPDRTRRFRILDIMLDFKSRFEDFRSTSEDLKDLYLREQ